MTSVSGRVLVLGGSGYVGRRLVARLGPARAVATYCSRPIDSGVHFDALTMDVSDLIGGGSPISHAVILFGDPNPESCAADVATSTALNVDSIRSVIDRLVALRIKPVFISSEFVFDGVKGNYVETDAVNPVLIYGRQKVAVERHLERMCGDYAIVRLAKVFGAGRGDGTLFTSWLEAIERGAPIRCAQDQTFSPIHVEDVAEALVRLVESDCRGVFHLAGPRPYRRIELLRILLARVPREAAAVDVIPCSIHDFPLRERRPLDVSMRPDKLVDATGVAIRDAETACAEIAALAYGDGLRAVRSM